MAQRSQMQASQTKQATVGGLMSLLEADLSRHTMTDVKQVETLTQLKILGREPAGADAIYCDHGIETLCQFAFGDRHITVAQEALKVIANALFLKAEFRAKLAGPEQTASLVKIYQRPDDSDEFLAGRILFLLTYGTKADFLDLIQSHHLVQSMSSHLERHSMTLSNDAHGMPQMATMALAETLKLIFNLANAYPDQIGLLSSTLPSLCMIMKHIDIPAMPFDLPVNTVINALAILQFEDAASSATEPKTNGAVYENMIPKLLEVLQKAIEKYEPLQLETAAVPLLTVLRKVYDVASPESKSALRRALLPDDTERDLPLGQSSSLASKLLRLISSAGLINLPESISSLLFELSDKDATTFVRNIGYGYAAGYLMTHKIPVPEGAEQGQAGGQDTTDVPINPITGQRLDREPPVETVQMTDEEKEREAERLFVLFERLRATGVVDVQNPLQQAVAEGRFEELSDSD